MSVIANTVTDKAGVLDNGGGTTVTNNTIGTNLSVLGNAAPVLDTPNTVAGKRKCSRRGARHKKLLMPGGRQAPGGACPASPRALRAAPPVAFAFDERAERVT